MGGVQLSFYGHGGSCLSYRLGDYPGRTKEIAGKIIGNAGVLTTIAFVGAVGMQYTW